jgi:general secretion pathway protein K
MRSHRRGYILIFAMMTLAVIGLIVAAAQMETRSRVRQVANIKGAAEAEAIADGAVRLLAMALWRELRRGPGSPSVRSILEEPLSCEIGRLAAVRFFLEDEDGKVDLNAASPALLQWLIDHAPGLARETAGVARSIVDYRERMTVLNGGLAFSDTAELRDALSTQPASIRALLPFVTVQTRLPGLDGGTVPTALRTALAAGGGQGLVPPIFQRPSSSSAFRIIAKTRLVDRAVFVREAIIDFAAGEQRPFAIRTWTRPEVDSAETPAAVRRNTASDQLCSIIFGGFDADPVIASPQR